MFAWLNELVHSFVCVGMLGVWWIESECVFSGAVYVFVYVCLCVCVREFQCIPVCICEQ